jgi:hypothetical protein
MGEVGKHPPAPSDGKARDPLKHTLKDGASEKKPGRIGDTLRTAPNVPPYITQTLLGAQGLVNSIQLGIADQALSAAASIGMLAQPRSILPDTSTLYPPHGNAAVTVKELDQTKAEFQAQLRQTSAKLDVGLDGLTQKYEVLAEQFATLSNTYDVLGRNLVASAEKLTSFQVHVDTLDKKTQDFEAKLAGSEHRSIEVVGLLSSIVALVLVSASTANSQSSPVAAYLIIVVAAAGLMLFACLLHAFFQPDLKRGWQYWVPFAVLPTLFIIGAGILLFLQWF